MVQPWRATVLVLTPVIAAALAWVVVVAATGTHDRLDSSISDLAALVTAALALLVALVSSAVAGLVLRRRAWLVVYLVLTAAAVSAALVAVINAGTPWRASRQDAAMIGAYAIALWLPVGARTLVASYGPSRAQSSAGPDGGGSLPRIDQDGLGLGLGLPRKAVGRSIGLCLAGAALVVIILASLPVGTVPSAAVGFGLPVVVVAALASGRTPQWSVLALLTAVGLIAVILDLPHRENGSLVVAALAVLVLLGYGWWPLAERLSRASDPDS